MKWGGGSKKWKMGVLFVKSGPFLNAGCIMYSMSIFILHFTYLGVRTHPAHRPPPAYGPDTFVQHTVLA